MSIRHPLPDDIESRKFDVIIIGAGINGAGIARDAAMRGLDVALIERHDIGSGTTSRSTRLIHGGLRYLEHGELGLVRESLRERETLLRIAPHLIRPLPILLPVYGWQRRSLATIRAGMLAYDLLSIGKSTPRHRILSLDEALAAEPALERSGLAGAARYHDCQVDFPERLAVENVIAAVDHGALILNHTRVERIVVADGVVQGVDVETGGGAVRINSSIVVNATGPWLDDLPTGIERVPLVGGTKGSHIVVGRFPGAPRQAVYTEARADGRPFFVIPWQDHLLIGTTDVPFSGNPRDARPSVEEIAYLIGQTRAIFPESLLTPESVRLAYAGVRPLPASYGRAPERITRRHAIRHHARQADGLYSVIGGKLTTFRSLAEEVTDIICRRLGHNERCHTESAQLPGGDQCFTSTTRSKVLGISESTIKRLSGIYGSRLDSLLKLVERDRELLCPLEGASAAIRAEIVFAVEHEHACTIADVLLRRTMLALRPGFGLDVLEPALGVAGRQFGWDCARQSTEREAFRDEIIGLKPPA